MTLFPSHYECENHPGMTAVAFCAVCAKPVCGDCMVNEGTAVCCNDAFHRTVIHEYALLGTCASLFDADLLSHNLAARGIPVHTFHPGTYAIAEKTRIFVGKTSVPQAQEIIASLELNDFLLSEPYDQ